MTKEKRAPARFAFSDMAASIGLLTRIPIKVDGEKATLRGARAAWAYPLVGLVVGAVGALVGAVAIGLQATPEIAAALSLVSMVIITGALHEDGLADCADGFWGGSTAARRLEIMKDSRIGAYGVIALVLGLLIRWITLSELFAAGQIWTGIISAAIISRVFMVAVMSALHHARQDGLAAHVGRPGALTAIAAAVLGLLLVFAVDPAGLWAAAAVAIPLICGMILLARNKIGGQTGDVLGATQQVSEMALLIVLASSL